MLRVCTRFLLGRPLANRESRERQIGVLEGVPAMGLDRKRPIDLLSTPAGAELVERHLARVDLGVYT